MHQLPWRIAAATAVLSLTAILLTGCSVEPVSPNSIVKSYLEAVQSGDAERALELVSPGVATGDRVLLTDKVLDEAGKIENIVVSDSELPAGAVTATVNATYEAGGVPIPAEFTATKASGKWVVAGAYPVLHLPGGPVVPSVLVNGVTVDVRDAGEYGAELPSFPGTYTVTLPDNELVTMKKTTVTAGSASDYKYTPSKSVEASFDQYLTAFLDTCYAADRGTRDIACPNWFGRADWFIQKADWTLTEAPVYELGYYGGPELSITSEEPVQQSVTADFWYYVGGPTEQKTLAEPHTLNFTAQVHDGAVTFAPSGPNRIDGQSGPEYDNQYY